MTLTAFATHPSPDSSMHCIELARIAAIIAAQGPILVARGATVPAEATVQYWSASRQRFELWNRGLGRLHEVLKAGRSLAARDWWHEHLAMLEEILISETLTRVLAAVGAALDGAHNDGDVEPITQSVFLTHLQVRNHVLRLLLFGRGGSVEQSLQLNRLRRCVELWTDRLLGCLILEHPEARRYTHDVTRANAFAAVLAPQSPRADMALRNGLPAALGMSLASMCDSRETLPQANRELCSAALACLHPDRFDSLGLLKSDWMQRLQANRSPECRPGSRGDHPLLRQLPPSPAVPALARWKS